MEGKYFVTLFGRNYFVMIKRVEGDKIIVQQLTFTTYKKAKKKYDRILDMKIEIEEVIIQKRDSLGCMKILDYVEIHNVI